MNTDRVENKGMRDEGEHPLAEQGLTVAEQGLTGPKIVA